MCRITRIVLRQQRTEIIDRSNEAALDITGTDLGRESIYNPPPLAFRHPAMDAAIGDDFDMMFGKADEEQDGGAFRRRGKAML